MSELFDEKPYNSTDMRTWRIWDWFAFWGCWTIPIGLSLLCALWSYASYHVMWLALGTYIGVLMVGCGMMALMLGFAFMTSIKEDEQ